MELFEIEMFLCIKMDLPLNNIQRLIGYKTNKQKKRQKTESSFDSFQPKQQEN